MHSFNRRDFLRSAVAATALGTPALQALLWSKEAHAQIGDTLTIAYNVSPPSWDPNSGPSSVSPGLTSIYRTIFDPYMVQREDLSLAPGVCDQFAWNADKSAVTLRVRKGVTWQDGRPLTASDVAWNLNRLATFPAPLQSIFASIKNIKVVGDNVVFDVTPWRANMIERLTFLGCYLIPPHYYEKVGKEGFEKAPMGSGPYSIEQFERGSFLRLKANKSYWGGAPAFNTVVFKVATDAATRIAEIERGSSDLTVDMPWEEFDRLKAKPGLAGVAHPTTDIAMIFLHNIGVMADPNVRKAAVHAIDKKLICDRIQRGYAKPIDTLLAPQYRAYDASISTPFDPKLAADLLAKSGFTRDKPVEFTIQTTRGYKPKDYETVQAIVEMWRRVGIKANIEVYEIAKHFELRTQHKLAPAAFYNWGNSTADPESSLGSAMFSKSPHTSWKAGEVDAALSALFIEKDDAKRMEGYKALNRTIAENAYVLPLFQFYQPVVYKSGISYKPHLAGFILPQSIGKSGK
jgi:peptide/nickel transport system substrate-binding protein